MTPTLREEMSPFQKFPLDLLHSLQLALLYLAHESLVQLVREFAEIKTHYAISKFKLNTKHTTLGVPTLEQKLLKHFK
jgi:hypothetical protein